MTPETRARELLAAELFNSGYPVQASEVEHRAERGGPILSAALRAIQAALDQSGEREAKLDDDGYLWKWVERGMFDPQITAKEALSVIAHHPDAPWMRVRWDVDHKPYAKQFYAQFPRAIARGGHLSTGRG